MKVRNFDSKKTLDVITYRLEVLSSKRIRQKLAAGEDVKGYWGKQAYLYISTAHT